MKLPAPLRTAAAALLMVVGTGTTARAQGTITTPTAPAAKPNPAYLNTSNALAANIGFFALLNEGVGSPRDLVSGRTAFHGNYSGDASSLNSSDFTTHREGRRARWTTADYAYGAGGNEKTLRFGPSSVAAGWPQASSIVATTVRTYFADYQIRGIAAAGQGYGLMADGDAYASPCIEYRMYQSGLQLGGSGVGKFQIAYNNFYANPPASYCSLTITGIAGLVGGTGYTGTVTATLTGGAPGTAGTAGTVTVAGGAVTGVSFTAGGAYYDQSSPPTISFTGGGGTGASATVVLGVTSNAIPLTCGNQYRMAVSVTDISPNTVVFQVYNVTTSAQLPTVKYNTSSGAGLGASASAFWLNAANFQGTAPSGLAEFACAGWHKQSWDPSLTASATALPTGFATFVADPFALGRGTAPTSTGAAIDATDAWASVAEIGDTYFEVGAVPRKNGAAAVTYQWYLNGARDPSGWNYNGSAYTVPTSGLISGATSTHYRFNGLTAGQSYAAVLVATDGTTTIVYPEVKASTYDQLITLAEMGDSQTASHSTDGGMGIAARSRNIRLDLMNGAQDGTYCVDWDPTTGTKAPSVVALINLFRAEGMDHLQVTLGTNGGVNASLSNLLTYAKGLTGPAFSTIGVGSFPLQYGGASGPLAGFGGRAAATGSSPGGNATMTTGWGLLDSYVTADATGKLYRASQRVERISAREMEGPLRRSLDGLHQDQSLGMAWGMARFESLMNRVSPPAGGVRPRPIGGSPLKVVLPPALSPAPAMSARRRLRPAA